MFAVSRNIVERYAELNGGDPAELAETPLFLFSALTFAPLCAPGAFVIAAKKSEISLFEKRLEIIQESMRPLLVAGGESRAESVFNGLRALPDSAEFAAIHDAARPFATKRLLLDCLADARIHGGSIAAKRVTDTIKRADDNGFVVETLKRATLWRMETPQVFKTRELRAAYEKALDHGVHPTDDAGAMELAGHRVHLLEHSAENRKITFKNDL